MVSYLSSSSDDGSQDIDGGEEGVGVVGSRGGGLEWGFGGKEESRTTREHDWTKVNFDFGSILIRESRKHGGREEGRTWKVYRTVPSRP